MKSKWMLVFPATLGLLLFGGLASADYIYNETITITLEDGTIVQLILSDSEVKFKPPEEPLQQIDMGYLNDPQRMERADLLDKYVDHSQNKYFWPSTKDLEQKVYYYLPPPPHISVDAEGRPEFLFMKFVTDRPDAEGGVSGGILHFLAEYGLTPSRRGSWRRSLPPKSKEPCWRGRCRWK